MSEETDPHSRSLLPSGVAQSVLDQLMNNMFGAVTVIDSGGMIQLVNRRILDLFGYSEDELVGRNVTVLMEPADAARHTAGLARYLRTREPHLIGVGLEVQGLSKFGARIPLHLTVSEMWLDGRIYFTGIMRDMSAERWARDSLERLRHRFEFAFDNALQATCLGDAEGNILEVNRRFAAMIGFPIDDLRRRRWTSLVHPDDLGPVLRALDALDPALSPTFEAEVRVVPREGFLCWVELKARYVGPDDDHLPSIIIQLEDITQRRVTLHSLRETQERLRTAFERSLIGQAIADLTGQLVAVNPAFSEMLGRSGDSLIGTNMDTFVHPDDLPTLRRAGDRLITRQDSGWRGELRLVTADGRRLWVMALVTASFGTEGQPVQLIAQIADITAQKDLLAALARSNADLQLYAHLVSHDLQAPLRTLSDYSESLLRSLDQSLLTDDQVSMFERVQNATADMRQLILDLLEMSKVDLASREQPVRTSVESAFDQVVERLQADIRAREADVRLDPDANSEFIVFPPGQLLAVLQNLIENSLRHPAEGRPLKILVTAGTTTADTIAITISDNGRGIPRAQQSSVFKLFRKGSDSDGTGLGLALVKRIVDNLGGEITLTSDGASGTEFTINLPRNPSISGASWSGTGDDWQ